MTGYFVSPPADATWALSAESVADRLRADWPDAEVRIIPPASGRTVSLEYRCAVDGEVVVGSLDRPGQVLVVRGTPRAAGRLIVWFRQLVADERDLIAYDESFEDSIPVPPGTTAQDVAAVLAGSRTQPRQDRGRAGS